MTLPKISQRPILYVDTTPDNDYPLRILQVYRDNCNCRWVGDMDNPLISATNQDQEKRAVILDAAIAKLKGEER